MSAPSAPPVCSSVDPLPGTTWLIGCGNMGGAMLARWLAAGAERHAITVIDPHATNLPAGMTALAAPPAGPAPDRLILAVKPQQIGAVSAMLAGVRVDTLISILAGVTIETLSRRFAADAVVRAMPNLPVALGKGVVGLHATGAAQESAAITAMMAPLGLVEWIAHEELFDALTALSGCGPGFVFRFIDALARAGAGLGLPADQAARLALATVEGAAAMAAVSPDSPATLADRVASPGGSTREGLNVLDAGGALNTLLARTLQASERRNRELGS